MELNERALRNVIEVISTIGDEEYQRSKWDIEPYCFFEETIHLFDDTNPYELVKKPEEYLLSEKQTGMIISLCKMLDKCSATIRIAGERQL